MLMLIKHLPWALAPAPRSEPSSRPPGRSFPRYFWLGLVLLAALSIQLASGWRWPWLAALQLDNGYKQLSGFAVLAFILYQWRFSVLRAQGDMRHAARLANRHKVFGALAPLLFLAHSQAAGYGYLQALCLVFLLVFLTGLGNVEILKTRLSWYKPLWVTVHVGLSMALLFLVGYHAYISYAFK